MTFSFLDSNGLADLAMRENVVFKGKVLNVFEMKEVPIKVEEGLRDKLICIKVNHLAKEANTNNVKRLIIEELKERNIKLWIISIVVKVPIALLKVNSLQGNVTISIAYLIIHSGVSGIKFRQRLELDLFS